MGVAFADRHCRGVHFHPESFATEHGKTLIANFLDLARSGRGGHVVPATPGTPGLRPHDTGVATRVMSGPDALGKARPAAHPNPGGSFPDSPHPSPPKNFSGTVPHRLLSWREPEDVFVSNFHNVTNSFWMEGGGWGAAIMGRASEAHVFRDW